MKKIAKIILPLILFILVLCTCNRKIGWDNDNIIMDDFEDIDPEFSLDESLLEENSEEIILSEELITEPEIPQEPELLEIFKQSYPDIVFEAEYDSNFQDWKITVINNGKNHVFYWNNGSMLPLEEMDKKEQYWTLLYKYNYKKPLEDPANFTEEQIKRMRENGTAESRRSGAGTPMFFFDAIYDSSTRGNIEKHIKKISFLGFNVNVHDRIVAPLSVVEKRIKAVAAEDAEVQKFLNSIKSNEGYFWRLIADTNRKSFHSLGIALDIQPKSYGGKEVYWSWARDKNPDKWMLTPLSWRWMPPQKVIDIFEEEGFIWGGKWAVWDNMHFEYHPELINFAKLQKD